MNKLTKMFKYINSKDEEISEIVYKYIMEKFNLQNNEFWIEGLIYDMKEGEGIPFYFYNMRDDISDFVYIPFELFDNI